MDSCENCFNTELMDAKLVFLRNALLELLDQDGRLFALTEIEKISLVVVLSMCSTEQHADCVMNFLETHV